MGTVLREYIVYGAGTDWMGSSFFNLAPNSRRTMEFTFDEPHTSAARRTGLPYAPLELEFRYIKNGDYITERHILPTGKGKIPIESSAGNETVWGEVKYRVKPLGGLPTGVRETINDGLIWPPPSK